jgi:hypothetical protein
MTEPVSELISAYLYGHITAEQYEQLRVWLAADPRHVEEYIREAYIHHATRLVLQRREAEIMHAGAEGKLDLVPADDPAELFRKAVESDLRLLQNRQGRLSAQEIQKLADRKLAAFLEEQHRQELLERRRAGLEPGRLKRSLLAAAGALAGIGTKTTRLAAIGAIVVLTVAMFIFCVREGSVVASLADTMDAQWDVNIEKHAILRKGQHRLEQGYARLVFQNGADVSIEAPAEFRLESARRMILLSGRLFAEVPPSARGFTVNTPHASIVDLGTQFGIMAEAGRASDLHLFKGKASLTPGEGSHAGQTQMLVQGQAKSVDRTAAVTDIPIQEDGFVRHFCSRTSFIWRGERLSLVDLVGEGNGLGNGRSDVFLDPVNGYTESLYAAEKGNAYHPLPSNPFIDGLFIPNGSRQVVSTRGHVFTDGPATNGECYASLGADPNQRAWATDKRNGVVRFDGQEYGNRDHPCLMMHANLGITFDLDAVRALCPDLKVTRFVARTAIADFNEAAGCNADFWVLVDGQVRQARRHVTQKAVLTDVSVKLDPADRFLTLVTTDGGDVDRQGPYQRAYTCDWCVFVEPALIVASE